MLIHIKAFFGCHSECHLPQWYSRGQWNCEMLQFWKWCLSLWSWGCDTKWKTELSVPSDTSPNVEKKYSMLLFRLIASTVVVCSQCQIPTLDSRGSHHRYRACFVEQVLQWGGLCILWSGHTDIDGICLHQKLSQAPPSLSNTDALSCLPLPSKARKNLPPEDVVQILSQLESTVVTATQIHHWSNGDPTLSRVKNYCMSSWPKSTSDLELQLYLWRWEEISLHDDCLLWGSRVIVPPQGREKILAHLHDTHPGVSRMKASRPTAVWWPGLDQTIEEMVKTCNIYAHCCQLRHYTPGSSLG